MSSAYPWAKALHIVFMAGWFDGHFCLPLLSANRSVVKPESHAVGELLLLMARRSCRFSIASMPIALLSALWSWLWLETWCGLDTDD
jgi:putative membrane protein